MKIKQKKVLLSYKNLSIFLLIVIFVLAAYILFQKPLDQNLATVVLPELSAAGYTEVALAVDTDTGLIKLGGNCYQVSATVEQSQAQSIQDGIDKVVGPRPNIHDLFNDLLKALDIKILMIKVNELKDGAYHSSFILRQGNTILNLDARPSDAIAVAVRTDYIVPMYFNETLLKAMGEKIC